MNYAVFLSGGNGSRTGADIPKQYIRAGKYMMVTHALKALTECEYIKSICVVADSAWQAEILADAGEAGLDTGKITCFASPGENRQLSALNGMRELIGNAGLAESGIPDNDTVLIHDAARPFLSESLLQSCYEAIVGHDGVMPVLPMKDTVYISDNGKKISGLIDRSTVFAGQAPELFIFRSYYEANIALLPDRIMLINGASEPAVMNGMDIVMVQGDEKNYKVTTAEDLKRFLDYDGV